MIIPIVVFILVLFGYALVSRRLEQTVLTAPIVFTLAGMLVFLFLPAMLQAGFNANVFLRLAEIGLVMLPERSRRFRPLLRNTRDCQRKLVWNWR